MLKLNTNMQLITGDVLYKNVRMYNNEMRVWLRIIDTDWPECMNTILKGMKIYSDVFLYDGQLLVYYSVSQAIKQYRNMLENHADDILRLAAFSNTFVDTLGDALNHVSLLDQKQGDCWRIDSGELLIEWLKYDDRTQDVDRITLVRQASSQRMVNELVKETLLNREQIDFLNRVEEYK